MVSLGDMTAATQIIAEDSENLMGVFGSESKIDVGSVCADKKNVYSSEKNGVGTLGGEGCGGTSVIDSVVDGGVVLDSSLNNLAASVENICDSDLSFTRKMDAGVERWKTRKRIDLNVERFEDQDHGFQVGDLVWGKIKNHPWWPGQVHDPRDASELALKHSQEGHVLVAFFGDGSCSWCLPSQLMPFVQNLEEMSADNSSKSFVNAVGRAVDEIGRVVESKITCKCIPLERRGHLARPLAANGGVKAGVLMPEVDIDCLPVSEYEPAEIHAKVCEFARSVSVGSLIDLTILKCWISAYYIAKRGRRLDVCSEPTVIEGLEDNNWKTATVPFKGPEVYDWISSPEVSSAKSWEPSDDKVYQRKKQKNVAELMDKKNTAKPENQKRGYKKKGKDDEKSANVDAEVEIGASQGKRGRKRRNDWILRVKTKATEVSSAKLESESTPRERKKSKYLSLPYTNIIGKIGYQTNSSGASILEMNSVESGARLLHTSYNKNIWKAKNEKKMSFPASDVDVEVHELLLKLKVAATDCFYLRKQGFLDSTWAFISAHRSSTYVFGSEELDPSTPMDYLISGARAIRQKLNVMTSILENCSSRLSTDDKSCLKHEMNHLMEDVDAASEKVRVLAENTSS